MAEERRRGSEGCMNRNDIDRDESKEGTNEGLKERKDTDPEAC
jgi:hypothetical protein